MASLTKAMIIERYGIEYYENFLAKQRQRMYERYHSDLDAARKRDHEKYLKSVERKRNYARKRRLIYRINSRDANRIAAMGILKDGQEVHHIKYHVDKHDDTWMNDILIMDREEHRKWHRDHPEFNALENIV